MKKSFWKNNDFGFNLWDNREITIPIALFYLFHLTMHFITFPRVLIASPSGILPEKPQKSPENLGLPVLGWSPKYFYYVRIIISNTHKKNAVWKSVLKQCLKIIFWIGARTLGDLYCKKNIFFFLKKMLWNILCFPSLIFTKHIGQVDRLEAKTYNWS